MCPALESVKMMFRMRSILIFLVVSLGLVACGSSDLFTDDGGFSSNPSAVEEGSEHEAGQLNAGEWRDLDNWSFWRALLDGSQGEFGHLEGHWGFNTADRFPVLVLDGAGEPAVDVRAVLLDQEAGVIWEARTNNNGEAELFNGLFGAGKQVALLMVDTGDEKIFVEAKDLEIDEREDIYLEEFSTPTNVIDVMFVIDTTGSMGDELSYLQVELDEVIGSVRHKHDLLIRTSVNFYRDEGEPFVVRSNPFSTNLHEVVSQMRREGAAGGGDYEEAVDLALEDAIKGHDWSPSARSRLLFLLLDAPPHHDPQALERIHKATVEAARSGVRIIPIGASGIDKETEFLMRFLDISTGGTYIFLTDDNGSLQPQLSPTVGSYEVEPLNELLIRLINESLR